MRLDAAVQAVQIRLEAAFGGSAPLIYEVPSGKVLVIEHVIFPDYWDDHSQAKSIIIRHGGAGTGGTIWDTQVSYSANFNTLFRPLKLPAKTAVAAPSLGSTAFQIFIYGLLVDEADLYASVPAEVKHLEHQNLAGTEVIGGTLELSSPRPTAVQTKESDDLKTWQEAPDVKLSPGVTRRERDFTYDVPLGQDRYFMQFSAHALLREDFPYYNRRILVAANGTVSTPFRDGQDSAAAIGQSGVSGKVLPRSSAAVSPPETTKD